MRCLRIKRRLVVCGGRVDSQFWARVRRPIAVWLVFGTRCLAAAGGALLFAMYSPVADWVIRPLVAPLELDGSDAIVLLTAWASPDGLLNDPALNRSVQAARLYRRGVATTILVSGRNSSSDAGPTAQLMSEFLEELGVPETAIVQETTSTNTHEAAVAVAEIAHARGWSNLTIVSDGHHMRRSLAAFRLQGLNVRSGADPRITLRSGSGPERLGALRSAAYEWIGLFYYWWHGWV